MRNIIGLIVTTFLIAMIYGLFVTTMDFMQPAYDPVASGHKAADHVYGFFGTVDNEVKRNDPRANPVMYRVAMPYAVTSDLSAIFGGKIVVGMTNLFHRLSDHAPMSGPRPISS